ncbi:aspartate carbamoyltransferase regulatory subunit [Candidatus Woesearchaeota archaeon]|nr:aspartate carbamoyltransferase regulatory subunit [Candidatus Woesearchaeota archaeon]
MTATVKEPQKEGSYKVDAIKEGVVIDHIPPKKALKVLEILGLAELDNVVIVGMNFSSKKMKMKDVVKIEKRVLTKDETDKISLIAPSASVSVIKDFKVVEKRHVEVPDEVKKVIQCPNPNCITQSNGVKSYFHIVKKTSPLQARCHYCEKIFDEKEFLF